MRVMAGRALLRSSMRGDHDLTLLRGPAGHLFVAKGAQLLRIGGNGKLAAGRVIDAGGHVLKHPAGIPATGSPVANLALNGLAFLHAVVHTFGPDCVLLGMAWLAVFRTLVLWFVRSDLRHRVAAVVAIEVERLGGEKTLGCIGRRPDGHHEQDEPSDMFGHGFVLPTGQARVAYR